MIADKLKTEMFWDIAKAETVVRDAVGAFLGSILKNEIEICPEDRK